MSRRPDHPLRPLTDTERDALTVIGRSRSEPAEHVTRARALLEVAAGASFSEAARRVGRKGGDPIGALVARFNDEGLAALASRKSTGRPPTYSDADRARILAEFARTPDREADGTATWSLVTLRDALRRARTACRRSARTRFSKCSTAPGTPGSATARGAPPARRSASARRARWWWSTPTRRPKKADRGRVHPGRGDGAVGVVRGRGGAVSDGALPRPELAARVRADARGARVRPQRHGKTDDALPPGERARPGHGYAERDQRCAPSVDRAAVRRDRRRAAADLGRASPSVAAVAGRAVGPVHAPGQGATAASALGARQPDGSQDALAGALAGGARGNAALHAARWQLAQHGGVDPAHPDPAGPGRSAPGDAG